MNVTDRDRLRHMLDAASDALSFAEGRTLDDLRSSRLLVSALARQIEIVGEAAARTSPECRSQIPAISWRLVVGMRNRLIHAYFDVDIEVVWSTVTADFPELVRVLNLVLRSNDEAAADR